VVDRHLALAILKPSRRHVVDRYLALAILKPSRRHVVDRYLVLLREGGGLALGTRRYEQGLQRCKRQLVKR
jgi:hypothetical protein